ncbi:MAG TPA: RdgB/HAM1 family non-canonical purine NTP pyrophosphatase [Acidimicrobiales bacterium]|jgi:XTP/dITP diphosphohydrolase|nr:RdgB/HAM1 family non-canonical purine NTP pyrophosphatase [Acidimicrobiales bacterium]
MSAPALRLVLASANPDKAVEIAALLEPVPGLTILPRPPSVPDVDETGETLLDNARLKARALVEATGEAAVADDTGLEVEALDGAPGVYTARFAGEHATYADNVAKLLAELARVGASRPEDRGATFHTVALVAFPDGREVWASGKVSGVIAPEAAGERGFGYDPVFVPAGCGGRSFAQMSPGEKHDVSHRGRAFRALAAKLLAGESSP